MSPSPTPAKGSTIRGVIGALSLLLALVMLPVAFVMMIRGVEQFGYGSEPVRQSLILMSVGGGLLGIGIAVLIWEFSVRYDVRH